MIKPKFNKPFDHYIVKNFMPPWLFEKYYNDYPVDYIKEYCSDPNVSEHEASLYGNYSAPLDQKDYRYDAELIDYIKKDLLPVIIKTELLNLRSYDHFYVNCHYDLPGSSLDVHNDLKDFRWLMTNQIYLDNSDQGVRLLNQDGSPAMRLPCEPNMFYSIPATPYSWHDVPELESEKRSILFRVGKRRWKTVAAPHLKNSCVIIYNNYHSDSHYAKLGLRMGNLTEAWLESKNVRNILHSKWRDPDHLMQLVRKAKRRYSEVRVVLSGYFPTSNPTNLADNPVMQTVKDPDTFVPMEPDPHYMYYHRITDDNIDAVAQAVFGNRDAYPSIYDAEEVLRSYTKSKRHLIYSDF